MGAKFAPSFFMAEWEDKNIYGKKYEVLLFYKRFIDNLFLIWEGTLLYNNIRLDFSWSRDQIYYLDVDVFRKGDSLGTNVYFKPTDHYNYLPLHSGHHPLWLKNIPKGQITRVRRNCTKDEDFLAHSNILKERFIQKDYDGNILENLIQEIKEVPQQSILIDKERDINTNQEFAFISNFHSQFKEVETIFKKHWHILCLDKVFKQSSTGKKYLTPQKSHNPFGIRLFFLPTEGAKPTGK